MSKVILVGLVAVLALSSCSSDEPGGGTTVNTPRREITLNEAESEVLARTNSFTSELIRKVSEKTPDENFVISPLSLSIALGMTANGAEGETQTEILSALGYGAGLLEDANSLNGKLLEILPTTDPSTKVSMANSLWFESSFSSFINPQFESTLASSYGSSLNVVNGLGGDSGMKIINSWSAETTNNLIPQLLTEPMGSETLMALTNSIYFKGLWAQKFNKKETSKQTFVNLDLSTSSVEMMSCRELRAQAYRDNNYKAIAIPYGNDAFCMIVAVPEYGTHPSEIFNLTETASIEKLAKGEMTEYEECYSLKLPRFTIENRVDFIPVLKEMGVSKAFSTSADFSGMLTESSMPVYIGKVLQASKIIVDEEGTEAASSTAVGGMPTSPGPMESTDFIVDRPFAFAIAERTTGTIVFTGVVTHL